MATAVSTAEVKTKYAAAVTALTEIHAAVNLSNNDTTSYGDYQAARNIQRVAGECLALLRQVEPLSARLP
jgi:hypothetical protein